MKTMRKLVFMLTSLLKCKLSMVRSLRFVFLTSSTASTSKVVINETLVILCFTLSIESNSCTLFDSLIIYSYFLLLLFHTRFFSYNAILCQLPSNLDNPPLFHSNRFRITCVTKHTTKD